MNAAKAQVLPPGTSDVLTTLKPIVDHASEQGFQWHFELLFFLLIGVVLFMAWSGGKIITTFVQAKVAADQRQHQQYGELAMRLREVEDSHRQISNQFAELQTRSVRAMEDVAEALREIKETIHRPTHHRDRT
jgi:uncharacterized protein YukE